MTSEPEESPFSEDDAVSNRTGRRKRVPRVRTDIAPTTPEKIRPTKLRIIGGRMRGRGVMYLGDRNTRPMKDSIRETLFNILGPAIKNTVAWDLFAGTGVLAIESISRGSVHSIAMEKSGHAAKTIRKSADAIGITSQLEVLTGDTFRIAPAAMRGFAANHAAAALPSDQPPSDQPPSGTSPWVVYFCPPYVLWTEDTERMFELLRVTAQLAPPRSQLVVETDKFFDLTLLPMETWDIRRKGNVTLSFLET